MSGFQTPAVSGIGTCDGRSAACETLDGFDFDRSALKPQHAAALDRLASCLVRSLRAGGVSGAVEIVGHTDPVGPARYNELLGLRRAKEIEKALRARLERAAPGSTRRLTINSRSEGERQPIRGSASKSRRVRVCLPKSQPGPTSAKRSCGPDATPWFLRQVVAATRSPAVLAIRAAMMAARLQCAGLGISSARVIEGSTATVVLAQEASLGAARPARTPAASAQLARARRGLAELARLTAMAATNPIARTALVAIGAAATAWALLVRTGGRYDFKNNLLRVPIASPCPNGCKGTLTLCGACFGSDVPGNLFYAHVGRWLGYSELALQLGSQFAHAPDGRSPMGLAGRHRRHRARVPPPRTAHRLRPLRRAPGRAGQASASTATASFAAPRSYAPWCSDGRRRPGRACYNPRPLP